MLASPTAGLITLTGVTMRVMARSKLRKVRKLKMFMRKTMSKFKMLEQAKEGRMRMKIYMTKKTERTTKKIMWMR
jgi:hypothetical protein